MPAGAALAGPWHRHRARPARNGGVGRGRGQQSREARTVFNVRLLPHSYAAFAAETGVLTTER
jgi:hypothetical protein